MNYFIFGVSATVGYFLGRAFFSSQWYIRQRLLWAQAEARQIRIALFHSHSSSDNARLMRRLFELDSLARKFEAKLK